MLTDITWILNRAFLWFWWEEQLENTLLRPISRQSSRNVTPHQADFHDISEHLSNDRNLKFHTDYVCGHRMHDLPRSTASVTTVRMMSRMNSLVPVPVMFAQSSSTKNFVSSKKIWNAQHRYGRSWSSVALLATKSMNMVILSTTAWRMGRFSGLKHFKCWTAPTFKIVDITVRLVKKFYLLSLPAWVLQSCL